MGDCKIKPICEYTPDGGIVGVEDECKQQSVYTGNTFNPEYAGLADSCECRGADKFQRMCQAGVKQNPLFKPAAENEEPAKPTEAEEQLTSYELAKRDVRGMVDKLRQIDSDGEGMITNEIQYEVSDDGNTAKVKVPFLSAQTIDTLDEILSDENPNFGPFYESFGSDIEYLAEAMKGTTGDGWQVDTGNDSYFKMEMINGHHVPVIGSDMTLTLTLTKS